MTLIEKLIMGTKVAREDIEDVLFEMCDRVHSQCDEECIVYDLNGGPVNSDKPFAENRGCDCFKSGKEMFNFIRQHHTRQGAINFFRTHGGS